MLPTFSACSKEICKIKKLLHLAPSDTGGTATIATNFKSSTASKPGTHSSSMAIGPLNVKPDPDKGHCDLSIETPQMPNKQQCHSRYSLA